MPEKRSPNGKLEEIETLVKQLAERLYEHQEQYRLDYKMFLTAQVLYQDRLDKADERMDTLRDLFKEQTTAFDTSIDKLSTTFDARIDRLSTVLREQGKDLDSRVDKLVLAIGALIGARGSNQPPSAT